MSATALVLGDMSFCHASEVALPACLLIVALPNYPFLTQQLTRMTSAKAEQMLNSFTKSPPGFPLSVEKLNPTFFP
jgi:hypothetical protein